MVDLAQKLYDRKTGRRLRLIETYGSDEYRALLVDSRGNGYLYAESFQDLNDQIEDLIKRGIFEARPLRKTVKR